MSAMPAPTEPPFAGGRRFDTPFGAVYATNITPDAKNGIGAWSYPAFERAMREGISRDGHHLYPAHPYTSFAGAEDADLQALYAYMMTQSPAPDKPPETKLTFPYNIRAMMAGWNALFLKAEPFRYIETRDAQWNRGAYLVETLGHCSACHTQRNVLGAEKTGNARLSGGFADGWEAPRAQHLCQRTRRLDGRRLLRLSAHRAFARPRQRRWPDGAGGRCHAAPSR